MVDCSQGLNGSLLEIRTPKRLSMIRHLVCFSFDINKLQQLLYGRDHYSPYLLHQFSGHQYIMKRLWDLSPSGLRFLNLVVQKWGESSSSALIISFCCVATLSLSLDLTDTGNCAGAGVCQPYLSRRTASVLLLRAQRWVLVKLPWPPSDCIMRAQFKDKLSWRRVLLGVSISLGEMRQNEARLGPSRLQERRGWLTGRSLGQSERRREYAGLCLHSAHTSKHSSIKSITNDCRKETWNRFSWSPCSVICTSELPLDLSLPLVQCKLQIWPARPRKRMRSADSILSEIR